MKKLLPLLLLALLCVFNFLKADAQIEKEPNNTAQQANILKLNDSLSGNISAGDVDWFQVTTTTDGRLDLKIKNFSNSSNIELQLFDGNATSMLHDTTIEPNTLITMPTDGRGKGTYFIKVFCINSTNTASYLLSDTLIAAQEKNDAEPNNEEYQHNTLIHINDTITGHIGYNYNKKADKEDWFVFTTTEDGFIHVAFTNESETKKLRCDFDDSLDDYAATFTPPGAESTIGYNGVQAGVYYVRISTDLLPANTFGSYKFHVWLDSTKTPNDMEPNDLPGNALPLALNGEARGHIGFFHNSIADTADWYKIILPQDGMLKLKLSRDYDYANYFYLYDSSTKNILDYGVYNNCCGLDDTVFLTDGLAAGTYYVKIQPYDQYFFGAYSIKDSLFRYTYSADTLQENNNLPYKAKEITVNQLIQAHAGFYNDGLRDTADWWKLNYTDASGKLELDFHLLAALIDSNVKALQVQIFSDTLTAPVYNGIIKDSADTIKLTSLKPREYYIKINCAVDSNWCAYLFKAVYNSVLATTLLNFSVNLQNNTSILKWQTNNEINCKGFEVQRSNNGQNFTTITFVNSKGNVPSNNYSFTDNALLKGINYYRLKQIDKDGKFNFSNVVAVDFSNNAEIFAVYPNPASSTLSIMLSSSNSISEIILYDANGNQKLYEQLASNVILKQLDISKLPAGFYNLILIQDGKQQKIKMIKK